MSEAPSPVTPHAPLFLASSNPGKVREFRAAAASRGLSVETLPCFADLPACLEDGATFEENARKKATHYSRSTAGFVFADDSGICVDALNGGPGVHSARFAGPQATDDQNNQRLLAEIHRVEAGSRPGVTVDAATNRKSKAENRNSETESGESQVQNRDSGFGRRVAKYNSAFPPALGKRAAHYVCVIALAQAGQVRAVFEGRADGAIIDEPRGAGGFGYDPYFFYPPLGKTFAEISPEEKFAISHRGAAFRKLLDYFCKNIRAEESRLRRRGREDKKTAGS